ncbi:MAG TPA: hypothetical protein VGN42_27885 [Pirellulales bacterium]|nr:hypothetical protein [Pirellulales bacterium]
MRFFLELFLAKGDGIMKAHVLAILTCAVVAATGGVRGEEAKKPREIIDRAIVEAGGRDALARYKQPFRQEFEPRGPSAGNAAEKPKIRITTWLPDKLRIENTRSRGGQAVTVGAVLNGKQGSGRGVAGSPGQMKYNHRTMGAAEMAGYEKLLYAHWVATLLPLDDKMFELSGLDEIAVDERPAVGVKVSRADRPEVRLYFDKESMMLVKLAWQPNETAWTELVFDDFAESDGLAYPRKITSYTDGKQTSERQLTEFEFLDKVEDGTFEKF